MKIISLGGELEANPTERFGIAIHKGRFKIVKHFVIYEDYTKVYCKDENEQFEMIRKSNEKRQ